ncbi:hypothetical protein AaE_013117 [Aphanomyces astaci]|uniref:DDE Tnp4 domain-containing protein n=1 Tax=Aphanomyces astaci TaxID=112090 RepID=A0A6A4Z6P6_APHAT|nr:hypothetical protein AaE_013117 [Aphanomyces astaci]
MKHYQTWEKHAVDFGLKAPTLAKLVVKVVGVCSKLLYACFVSLPRITTLRSKDKVFTHYPYALYATDVKFQAAHRPSGRFGEEKYYFSGKHKLYGFKIEASVSPEGLLVDMSPHEPGSVSDLTMFRSRLDQHTQALVKDDYDDTINDNGELFREHPTSWTVLVDKGYIGLAASARAIHPKKKPVSGTSDRFDMDRNKEVSSDRVVVQNFFGRVCSLWKVSYATFVWGEKLYDDIQRFTFALTNFHATLMPLRLEDNDHYRAVMARYKSMAAENTSKRAANQRRYLQRRAERFATEAARASRTSRGTFLSPMVSGRR